MSIRNDTDELIAFLDSLAKIDPIAMGALIAARVPCNATLANHPTVQCGAPEGAAEVGMLGVLNGYAGVYDDGPRKGWGPISATVELDGRCTGFCETENWSHPVVSIGVEPAVGDAPAPQSSNERVLALQLRDAIAWLESTVVQTQAQWDMQHRMLRRIAELLEQPAAETNEQPACPFAICQIKQQCERETVEQAQRAALKTPADGSGNQA